MVMAIRPHGFGLPTVIGGGAFRPGRRPPPALLAPLALVLLLAAVFPLGGIWALP
jgi:hypothetical protein